MKWRSTAPPTAMGGAPPRQRTAADRMLGRPAGGAGLGNRMKQSSIAVVAAAFGLACICAQAADPVPVEAFADTDRVTDRKSVVEGKRVSVRVDLGGRRTIKKKQHEEHIATKYVTINMKKEEQEVYC